MQTSLTVLALTVCTLSGMSPTGSLQITTPQRWSISLGVCFDDGFGAFGPSSGMVARLEPGISGGKLHLGVRSIFSLAFLPVTSMDITGAVLRTWNDPWGEVEGGETYLGGEYRFSAGMVLATAGYYRKTDGEKWITSLGAGIGL